MLFCTHPDQTEAMEEIRVGSIFCVMRGTLPRDRQRSGAARGGSRDRPESLGTPERAERIVVDAPRVTSALRIREHGATARACAAEIRVSSPSPATGTAARSVLLFRSPDSSLFIPLFFFFFFREKGSVWICLEIFGRGCRYYFAPFKNWNFIMWFSFEFNFEISLFFV